MAQSKVHTSPPKKKWRLLQNPTIRLKRLPDFRAKSKVIHHTLKVEHFQEAKKKLRELNLVKLLRRL